MTVHEEGWPVHPLRLPPVHTPDSAQAEALAKTPTLPDGTIRNLFLTLAWQPVLLKRFNVFMGTFMVFNTITSYEREVVVLRVATIGRSRYELAQHIPLAQQAGITDDTIRALLAYPSLDGLNDDDRMLAALTDEIDELGHLTEVTWIALRARFAEPSIVELIALVTQYRMVAEFLNTLGVELEPDLRATIESWIGA
ncbi:MAG: carboxymuconolactone decarboxylase [Subtercola sp.]|nr:carboxymuconolactone decarboxylase [Subtercola sp.]